MSAETDRDFAHLLGHWGEAARRKAGFPEDWCAYSIDARKYRGSGDVLVEGGVPIGIGTRDDRKGLPIWESRRKGDRVRVTEAEERTERLRYEAETGKCADCYGRAQKWKGAPCDRCGATGKAPSAGTPA